MGGRLNYPGGAPGWSLAAGATTRAAQLPPQALGLLDIASSRPPSHPKDVWKGYKRPRAEGKALAALDHKPSLPDGLFGLAGRVAATKHLGPEGYVCKALKARPKGLSRDHMLIKAELSTRFDHPKQFGQGALLVRNR